jgi:hypothetical protein
MSSSVTTLAPVGQQHDREDADMGEATGRTNESSFTHDPGTEPLSSENDRETNSSTVAVEVATVDEDAMDTTPDIDAELVMQDGAAGLLESNVTPTSPPTHEAAGELASHDQVPPHAPLGDVVSQA